jgi:hypothetical protein
MKRFGFLHKGSGHFRAADRDASPVKGPEQDAAGVDPGPALIPPPCFTVNAGADAVAHAVDAYVAALMLRTLLRPESAARVAKLVADDAAGSNSEGTNPIETEKVLRRCFDETVMSF